MCVGRTNHVRSVHTNHSVCSADLQQVMTILKQWAAATYTGEGPLADGLRTAIVEMVMLQQAMLEVTQTTPQTVAVVEEALEQSTRVTEMLASLLDHMRGNT